MSRKLGQLENAALALAQMRNLRTVRVGEIVSGLRISAKQERELLRRMSRSGMIANVRKGLYPFPQRLPLGGIWTPDDATAINALMADKEARYQITGHKAFNRTARYRSSSPWLTSCREPSPAPVAGQHAGLGARRRVAPQQIEPAADQPLGPRHAEMAIVATRITPESAYLETGSD